MTSLYLDTASAVRLYLSDEVRAARFDWEPAPNGQVKITSLARKRLEYERSGRSVMDDEYALRDITTHGEDDAYQAEIIRQARAANSHRHLHKQPQLKASQLGVTIPTSADTLSTDPTNVPVEATTYVSTVVANRDRSTTEARQLFFDGLEPGRATSVEDSERRKALHALRSRRARTIACIRYAGFDPRDPKVAAAVRKLGYDATRARLAPRIIALVNHSIV